MEWSGLQEPVVSLEGDLGRRSAYGYIWACSRGGDTSFYYYGVGDILPTVESTCLYMRAKVRSLTPHS